MDGAGSLEAAATDPDVFPLGGEAIPRRQSVTIDLPVGKLYTHAQMTMPVHVIRGQRPGPILFLCAAIHGDEINGVEIIRRIIRRKGIRRLRGTLLAIPVVNVHGLIHHSRYVPDRRDLNRSFPGSAEGSMTGQLAHMFLQEIVKPAHLGIDLHTGSNHRTNLPQVRAQLDSPEIERLARVFGAPVILDAALRDGSLRQAAETMGTRVLVYEGGEALRFDEWAVRTGVRGILRVMRDIGMLSQSRDTLLMSRTSLSRRSTWARASQSGIVRSVVRLGAQVEKDQVLCLIGDPFGDNETEVLAPAAGIIIGQTTKPLANRGEALYHIALFDAPEAVAARIKDLRQDFDAEPDG